MKCLNYTSKQFYQSQLLKVIFIYIISVAKNGSFQLMKPLWNRNYHQNEFYLYYVLCTLLNGSETWAMKEDIEKPYNFDKLCLRYILGPPSRKTSHTHVCSDIICINNIIDYVGHLHRKPQELIQIVLPAKSYDGWRKKRGEPIKTF